MKPDYFTKPEVKQIRLDSTYMKDILKKEVTITKDLFEKIHSVLQNRVEWDESLTSLIWDILVWDRIIFNRSDESVRITRGSMNTPILHIIFKDTKIHPKENILKTTPFFQGASLGDFLMSNGPASYKKNSCWPSVAKLLLNYGIPKELIPTTGRDGCNWGRILERPELAQFFQKVSCDRPREALAGDVCVYEKWATLAKWLRQQCWHTEIKWPDHQYYSYYASKNPWGSIRINQDDPDYQKKTGFTGYVYRLKPQWIS